ncbi:MAG: tRNA lysidine(34) synthetase TilS [Pseudomonadota bacterium]
MPQSLRQHLLDTLAGLPSVPHYWVAFSGGLDSTVLLHLLASLRGELALSINALHVDHGLAPQSRQWSAQCRTVCEQLNIPFRLESVAVDMSQGKGLEAAARHARYAVFERVVGEGEALLTAHHRDDQAETLLLQLLRGGGVHGLAAMPLQRPLGNGHLLRPLLDIPRQRLRAYAEAHGLSWIDDPSNFDTALERNYLRHTLLPQLAERRAGIRDVLARSAGHFAESATLLDELAKLDRQQASDGEGRLSVSALNALTPERCRNLLRYHLRQVGLPVPTHAVLQSILDEVLLAREDAAPLVAWSGAEVRRYRDSLYCMPPLPVVPAEISGIPWDGSSPLQLPGGLGEVSVIRRQGAGISPSLLQGARCELRLRQGGERIELRGRLGCHELKKLYQEAGLPPWERERRPLLYIDGELAQVAGLWTAAPWAAQCGEEGVLLHWRATAIEKRQQNDDN